MKWLVTFKSKIGRERVLEQLRSLPCEIRASDRSTPLGDDEEVMAVEGPADLARLADGLDGSLKLSPNSRMSNFR